MHLQSHLPSLLEVTDAVKASVDVVLLTPTRNVDESSFELNLTGYAGGDLRGEAVFWQDLSHSTGVELSRDAVMGALLKVGTEALSNAGLAVDPTGWTTEDGGWQYRATVTPTALMRSRLADAAATGEAPSVTPSGVDQSPAAFVVDGTNKPMEPSSDSVTTWRAAREDSANGLSVVERFFGEELGEDLYKRVLTSPTDHLFVLAERLLEWKEQSIAASFPYLSLRESGQAIGVVEPRVALFDRIPIAARDGLDIVALLAPRILINDPFCAWAQATLGPLPREWPPPRLRLPYGPLALLGNPNQVLTEMLAGIAPVKPLIDTGDIVFAPGADVGPGNYLYDMRLVRDRSARQGYPHMWADTVEPGRAALGLEGHRLGVSDLLNLAESVSSLVRATHGLVAPTGLDDYFVGPESKEAIALGLPKMDLSLQDVLLMRRNEAVFEEFREALRSVALSAGRAYDYETPIEYAARIRTIASTYLLPVEENLQAAITRGKIFGLVPGAAGGVVRLVTGLVDWVAPGAPQAAAQLGRTLVKNPIAAGRAAERALHYGANLRLTGRL